MIRNSSIEGRGVFAGRAFLAHQAIWRFDHTRRIAAEETWPMEFVAHPEHCDRLAGGDIVLLVEPDSCINASCDPSCYVRWTGEVATLAARRDIAPGEELTTDYLIGSHDEEPWDCRCGSARCRGRNPGSYFDLPAAIRREYEPLLAGWFIRQNLDRYRASCRELGLTPRA